MEAQNGLVLSTDFRKALSAGQTLCSVPIDNDILAWMQSEGSDVAREINGLLRFYMDTSISRELECRAAAWVPTDLDMGPAAETPALS